jgi:hypothetical protein
LGYDRAVDVCAPSGINLNQLLTIVAELLINKQFQTAKP